MLTEHLTKAGLKQIIIPYLLSIIKNDERSRVEHHAVIRINNSIISNATHFKHLGDVMSSKLNWILYNITRVKIQFQKNRVMYKGETILT